MMELLQTLTPIQAAKYLGISEAVLRLWRSEGKGPRHFKAGKSWFVTAAPILTWIEARLSAPQVAEVQ